MNPRRRRIARSRRTIRRARGVTVSQFRITSPLLEGAQALIQAKRLEWHRWWRCCPQCRADGARWRGRREMITVPAQCVHGVKDINVHVTRYQRRCRACGYESDVKRQDPAPPEPAPDLTLVREHARHISATHTSAPVMLSPYQGERRYRRNGEAGLVAWQEAFYRASEGACTSLEFVEPAYDSAVDSDHLDSPWPVEERKRSFFAARGAV